jgi:hypothetical protein
VCCPASVGGGCCPAFAPMCCIGFAGPGCCYFQTADLSAESVGTAPHRRRKAASS